MLVTDATTPDTADPQGSASPPSTVAVAAVIQFELERLKPGLEGAIPESQNGLG